MPRMLFQDKSGMATVLGMLIFIGVIFTCIIPLFLYVNQVNSFYDTAVADMRRFDQDREMERLEVYAFPVGETLTELNVYLKNKCALEVRVVRVWVNDIFYDAENLTGLPLILSGVSEDTITAIAISPPGDFDISVTTNRGNIFASLTNTIQITVDPLGWEQGAYNFGIPIFVNVGGQYEVTVTDNSGFTDVVIIKSAPTAYRMISVPKPGTYYITVTGETWNFERYVNWEYPIAEQVNIPP